MGVIKFEWDKANIEHISRHNVTPEEAEEVFTNRHITRNTRDGRYLVFGQTDDGRYLLMVYIQKKGRIRVITARDMNRQERRYYMRH